MNTFNVNNKIGDIVIQFPRVAEIFKEYEIDFCCGGDRSLGVALKELNLSENEVLNRINNSYDEYIRSVNTKETDWTNAPILDLVNHIVNRYHAYLYMNLPKISELTTKIYKVHGINHPELAEVHKLFHMLKMELEAHTIKEETIQYPAIEKYVKTKSESDLDKAIEVIQVLNDEHVGAGSILKKLRKVTNNYTVPEDGCTTYYLAYEKLQELESDTFEHIHLENNILFPRLFELDK